MTIKQNKEPFTCPKCGTVVEFTLGRLEKYKSCKCCGRSLTSKERDDLMGCVKVRSVLRKMDGKKEPRKKRRSSS